jgi:hypothetical protein
MGVDADAGIEVVGGKSATLAAKLKEKYRS